MFLMTRLICLGCKDKPVAIDLLLLASGPLLIDFFNLHIDDDGDGPYEAVGSDPPVIAVGELP